MPGYNQTGPRGEGKMTGRQRGMCRRTDEQSFQDLRGGRGRGLGLGRRAGSMQDAVRQSGAKDKTDLNPENGFYDNLKSLKEQYRETQELLRTIEKKIKTLESRE